MVRAMPTTQVRPAMATITNVFIFIILLPAIAFVTVPVPSVLVVVAAIVAEAVVINAREGFFFVAVPTLEG